VTVLRWGSATDVGKVRATNQDRLLEDPPLFAVADGMGGHAAGEVAALTAVEALRSAFSGHASADGLVAAAAEANRSVWRRAAADPDLRGMGTTLVALALVSEEGEDRLAIVNVGDSRLYRLRNGELEQLTTDHRLVQELVDEGQLSEAEASVHPQRNVLTRALGVDPDVAVDVLQVLPFKGDRYLLCSDGLSGELADRQLASVLRRFADPQEAARELIADAKANGGADNITVVIVDVVDDDDQAAAASAALAEDPGLVIASGVGNVDAAAPGDRTGRPDRRGRLARTRRPDPAPRARLVTLRVVAFVAALLVLLGAAIAAIGWYARGSYFVGIQQAKLTIYQGRPGGLLWFKPTVAQRTGVPTDAVLPSRLDDLRSGKQEGSLGEANRYVGNLVAEARAHDTAVVPAVGAPDVPGTVGITGTTTGTAVTAPAVMPGP
jgi:protein phosphatase